MTDEHDQNAVAAPQAAPELPAEHEAPLSALEVRVLGCLIEKECTTPDTYPMTLNSLVLACNQKSNRAPLMDVDAQAVTNALDSLREKKHVWVVTAVGSRVPKYQHDLAKRVQVSGGARAILCELCLRGPQTVAELRARSARMHSFADAVEFERALDDLLNRPNNPLAARVAAAPGQRGMRYAHLLSGAVESVAAPASSPIQAETTPSAALDRIAALEAEVMALRAEVASLRGHIDSFAAQFK